MGSAADLDIDTFCAVVYNRNVNLRLDCRINLIKINGDLLKVPDTVVIEIQLHYIAEGHFISNDQNVRLDTDQSMIIHRSLRF